MTEGSLLVSPLSHPRVEYIAVGDELLGGAKADTNSLYLQRALLEVGCEVDRCNVVRDNLETLAALIQEAASRSNAVIISGGLGTTHDDLTREAIAKAVGVSVSPNPEAESQVRAYLMKRGRETTAVFECLWHLPQGAEAMINPAGLAPGVFAKFGTAKIFALPGVPHEFGALVDSAVVPGLSLDPSVLPIVAEVIQIAGVAESDVATRIESLIEEVKSHAKLDESIRIGITAHSILVTLRIQATTRHRHRLDDLASKAIEMFSDNVIGRGERRLEWIVGRQLIDTNTTIAVAESCTGGLLSTMLTSVPGISAVFLEGCVTYSNEAKIRTLDVDAGVLNKFGAVSREVAEAMATGVAARSGADIGIGITGVAGPGGGTADKPVGLIYVALFLRGELEVHELRSSGTRESIQEHTVLTTLDRLRRRIEKMK